MDAAGAARRSTGSGTPATRTPSSEGTAEGTTGRNAAESAHQLIVFLWYNFQSSMSPGMHRKLRKMCSAVCLVRNQPFSINS